MGNDSSPVSHSRPTKQKKNKITFKNKFKKNDNAYTQWGRQRVNFASGRIAVQKRVVVVAYPCVYIIYTCAQQYHTHTGRCELMHPDVRLVVWRSRRLRKSRGRKNACSRLLCGFSRLFSTRPNCRAVLSLCCSHTPPPPPLFDARVFSTCESFCTRDAHQRAFHTTCPHSRSNKCFAPAGAEYCT